MSKDADSPTPTRQPSKEETPTQPAVAINKAKHLPVPLGEIVATANAASALSRSAMIVALGRHCSGDWGEVCKEDWQLNDEALEVENRLHSVYQTADGVKFWIITEWDRSVTTILLPEDY